MASRRAVVVVGIGLKENAMAEKEVWDERLAPRKKVSVPVEVTLEGQTFSATMQDISERGMRLQTSQPIAFKVQVKTPEGVRGHTAYLVWARHSEDGVINCGLRFEE